MRNNGHAQSALQAIVDDTVGWGIRADEEHEAWLEWSETSACDADGQCNFAGIQHLVMRTVVESGECLVRRRVRRLSDGLPLPFQLQVLEPDFIDSSKHGPLEGGRRVIRGVEFDAIGRRVGYWLFREHPGSGSNISHFGSSVRVPASEIAHVYRPDRPGQVRAASWFAPVLLRFNDFDEFADATVIKQKTAAALVAFVTDIEGSATRIGDEDPNNADIDMLEPGLIKHLPMGATVETLQPPSVRDYPDYVQVTLREIASGIGVTYEDMTGDYTELPFSAARMSRLRHRARVDGWHWRMLVPQLLNRTWAWAMQMAEIMGGPVIPSTGWTPPPMAMIDPKDEGLAVARNVRAGIMTPSEAVRERGWSFEQFLDRYESDMQQLDERGLIIDSDARKMTQAGQLHTSPGTPADPDARLRELLDELPDYRVAELLQDLGSNGDHAS